MVTIKGQDKEMLEIMDAVWKNIAKHRGNVRL